MGWVGRNLKIIQFYLPLSQAPPSPVQPGSGHFQWWGSHSCFIGNQSIRWRHWHVSAPTREQRLGTARLKSGTNHPQHTKTGLKPHVSLQKHREKQPG